MYYVYRIRSEVPPFSGYIGFTRNLRQRLLDHNQSNVASTRHGIPWKLAFYAAFELEEAALAFERYLKSGSGTAFAQKRLWPE